MKYDFGRRFGFLAAEVAKLYGDLFDALARERIGLSRAQCRLLGALASTGRDDMSQAELAQRLDLTPMAVATLCERMEAAGWLQREASVADRRVRHVRMTERAADALDAAIKLGDSLTSSALAELSAAERAQLLALMGKAREGLLKRAAAQRS